MEYGCDMIFKEAVKTVSTKLGGNYYHRRPVHTILTVDSKVVRMRCRLVVIYSAVSA